MVTVTGKETHLYLNNVLHHLTDPSLTASCGRRSTRKGALKMAPPSYRKVFSQQYLRELTNMGLPVSPKGTVEAPLSESLAGSGGWFTEPSGVQESVLPGEQQEVRQQMPRRKR